MQTSELEVTPMPYFNGSDSQGLERAVLTVEQKVFGKILFSLLEQESA